MDESARRFEFKLQPENFAICRLDAGSPIPPWAEGPGFVATTRTADELSIVCDAACVPKDVRHVAGRRVLGIVGAVDFATTGVLSGLLAPLAEAKISVFVVSTFDTDFVLVEEKNLAATTAIWRGLGHSVA